MGNLNKNLKSAVAMSGSPSTAQGDSPSFYASRKKQYFAQQTADYVTENAQYASDYFQASAQGLDYNNFYEWRNCKIRLSDVSSKGTSSLLTEDYKNCYFAQPSVEYVGLGAKINCAGSTYLVSNPSNISSVTGNAVVRKCNAVYRSLDYYGNILAEPFVWEKGLPNYTANDYKAEMVLANDYQHSMMQLNSNTESLRTNKRLILGTSAYAVRGLVDFVQEFTDDPASTHIMYFDLYRVEPTQNDDIENGVAGGKAFSWNISISGNAHQIVGTTQQLLASSTRNGVPVTGTAQLPISYLWSVSDPSVAAIDADGNLTAIAPGNVVATAVLAQNNSLTATLSITVESSSQGEFVAFTTVCENIRQLSSGMVSAAYYLDGEKQTETVSYQFSGADASCYTATQNQNNLSIQVWKPSETPLTITAFHGEKSASISVMLLGY